MLNNKTLVLGLDSSKRSTGACLIYYSKVDDKDVFELYKKVLIKTKYKKDCHLFQSELDSYNMLEYFLKDDIKFIDYCVIEGFAFGGTGLTQLSATAAVYQLLMAQNNIPVVHIAPKRVKLIIADSGNATKEVVQEKLNNYIINYSDVTWPSLDVSDSAAIGIAGTIVNLYPERFIKNVKKKSTKTK